jgi:hypothetical protein
MQRIEGTRLRLGVGLAAVATRLARVDCGGASGTEPGPCAAHAPPVGGEQLPSGSVLSHGARAWARPSFLALSMSMLGRTTAEIGWAV